MSARATMRHRALIERNNSDQAPDDSWGGEPEPDWKPHLQNLPCKTWFKAGREVTDIKVVAVEDRRMIVPLGTDITELDRVARVTDRRGVRVLFDGPARIESVGARADHLELTLEAA